MEIYAIIRAILKKKKTILLLSVSAVVQTVILTYVLTDKYRATALVLIRPKQTVRISSSFSSKEVLDFPVPATVPYEAMLQTFAEVLKSRAIIERVVHNLHLDVKRPEKIWWRRLKNEVNDFLSDTWTYLKYGRLAPKDPFQDAVETVSESLKATPTKDTYIFEMRYDAKDPQVAATVVNSAAAMLVEYYADLAKSDSRKNKEFLAARLNESEGALKKSRETLRAFKEKNSVTLIDSQVKAKIELLSGFQKSLDETRKDLEGTKAEISEILRQLGEGAPFLKSAVKTGDNPLVTQLNSDLAKAEIDLSSKLKVFAPSHPDIQVLQEKVSKTKQRIQSEVSRKVLEETSSLNSVHQSLANDLAQAETRLQGSRAKERELGQTIAHYESDLKEFPRKQAQLSKLDLDLAVTEDTHRLIVKEYEDAVISEVEIIETHLISDAYPPTYPVKPVKIYYAGVALAIAIAAGIGFALFNLWLESTRGVQT